jgi:hypothetical protein
VGYFAHEHGEHVQAVRMLAAASALAAQLGSGPAVHERAVHEHQIEALRERLGAQTFEAAWADGEALTLEQTIACALDTLASIGGG